MLGDKLFRDLPEPQFPRLNRVTQRRRLARNEVVFLDLAYVCHDLGVALLELEAAPAWTPVCRRRGSLPAKRQEPKQRAIRFVVNLRVLRKPSRVELRRRLRGAWSPRGLAADGGRGSGPFPCSRGAPGRSASSSVPARGDAAPRPGGASGARAACCLVLERAVSSPKTPTTRSPPISGTALTSSARRVPSVETKTPLVSVAAVVPSTLRAKSSCARARSSRPTTNVKCRPRTSPSRRSAAGLIQRTTPAVSRT